MKSRRQIERAIQQSPERRVGEEGVAHKIVLDNKAYFAKLWRGKHPQEHGDPHLYYAIDSEKSPYSPFWHKLQYWEYKLMHEAFPDEIVKMTGSYDPRISKDGEQFDFHTARPVTITEAVQPEEELMAKRDEWIGLIYNGIETDEITNEDELVRGRKNMRGKMAAFEFDQKMEELFGKDLNAVFHAFSGGLSKPEYITRFIERANEKFPETRMAELISSGILPIHAAANFIPTGPSDERGIKGVLIEARIYDPNLLRERLVKQRLEKNNRIGKETVERNVERDLQRYTLLRRIDRFYDQVFMMNEVNLYDEEKEKDARQRALKTLDRIRERFDKEGTIFDESFFTQLKQAFLGFEDSFPEYQKLSEERVTNLIESWGTPKEQAAK